LSVCLLQEYESGLVECEELLAEAQKSSESVMANLSPSGKNRMQQDLQSLTHGFVSLKSQLGSSLTDFKICLSTWQECETEFDLLSSWITTTEEIICGKPLKHPSLEAKKTCVDDLQVQQVLFSFVTETC